MGNWEPGHNSPRRLPLKVTDGTLTGYPSVLQFPPGILSVIDAYTAGVNMADMSTYHLVSAATTNATNIKNSAGRVYGWYIYNSNAAMRKIAFHNSSSTPTAGASVFFSLCIPPLSGANVFATNGIYFSSGIGITTVTGAADSDNTAVAANDLVIDLFYV